LKSERRALLQRAVHSAEQPAETKRDHDRGDALDRIAGQAKQRPLLTLAVAIGVGILIGAAGRRR